MKPVSGDSDVDRDELADPPVAHQLARIAEVVRRALLASGLKHGCVSPGGLDHLFRLANGQSQRLFAVDVLARATRGDGDDGVPVIRHSDEHGVDVRAGKQLLELVVSIASGERAGGGCAAVLLLDLAARVLALDRIHVADGYNLYLGHPQKGAEMPATHVSHPDNAQRDPLTRRRAGTAP